VKIWLLISIALTIALFFLMRYAKGHQTDGDMGTALITLLFLALVLLNWLVLGATTAYRYLNASGA